MEIKKEDKIRSDIVKILNSDLWHGFSEDSIKFSNERIRPYNDFICNCKEEDRDLYGDYRLSELDHIWEVTVKDPRSSAIFEVGDLIAHVIKDDEGYPFGGYVFSFYYERPDLQIKLPGV